MTIIEEIEAERRRQIEVEGWSDKHDDQHAAGEMYDAAVCYLAHSIGKAAYCKDTPGLPLGWPWDPVWWKPKDPRRNLIRAGALCLAEKDRIGRVYHRRKGGRDHGPRDSHVMHVFKQIVDELVRIDGTAQA